MIRRNHIEPVTNIDRQLLRFDGKDQYRQSNSKKYSFKKDAENIDQSFRVASSNKKYHQYKDWKGQNKTKIFQSQPKQINKFSNPLTQFQANENKCQNNLKRNYDQQFEEKTFNFNNLKGYQKPIQPQKQSIDQKLKKKRYSEHYYRESQPVSIEVRQPSNIGKRQINHLQRLNYESTQLSSPSKRKTRYISTQKFQQSKYPTNYKQFTPLFDIGTIPNKPQQKWQKRSQVVSSAKAPGKIAIYENSLRSKKQDTFRSFQVGGFQAPKLKKQGYEDKLFSKQFPVNKMEKEDQQVCIKLKKISQFNDQINQRIKNIISCFETLKGKF